MGATQLDPHVGRLLMDGQFRILEKIGSGGMGAVYKASQTATSRFVAVKILHAQLAQRQDLVARFRREARAMSHLTHPNTVKVLLYGELPDGALFIVMEYLEGRNLNQVLLDEGRLPVERAVPILLHVCGALQEAHEQKIVHRDLKPENIFLCRRTGGLSDVPKVLDFGLAKVSERDAHAGSMMLTQEGMVFGTPEFMSPEQAQGKELDARSDIYSLAVILFELLTGKLPFDANNPMEYVALHVTKAPLSIDERVPGLSFPHGLSAVIAKALAKKPDDRYGSAAEFAEALKRYAPFAGGGLALNLRGSEDDSASGSATVGFLAQPASHPEAVAPSRSAGPVQFSPWVWGGIAVACVGAGAIVMLALLRVIAALTG